VTATLAPPATWDFVLPPSLEAHEPPEVRGRGRDDVRLMVARVGDLAVVEATPADLVDVLAPGDLLVVNTSATVPAALPAVLADGTPVRMHLSTRLATGLWLVELRRPDGPGSAPLATDRRQTVRLPAGGNVELLTPYPPSEMPPATPPRLWVAAVRVPGALLAYLGAHGQPIRYGHAGRAWPLSAYQTVYATEPGSAEMPSAGRPFTAEIITGLVARGIDVAPIVLHAGVSSLEGGEDPYPERYRVPAGTAGRVNATRAAGGRVVAVGPTVVRALETAADDHGTVHPAEGWTELVITPERGVRAVDGLVTGWHEPRASHLRMLEAIAGRPLLVRSYEAALAGGYLWHEFGDLHVILP